MQAPLSQLSKCTAIASSTNQQCRRTVESKWQPYCNFHRRLSVHPSTGLRLEYMGPTGADYYYFILKHKRARVGEITFTMNDTPHELELESVSIEPAYRGRGLCTWAVGKALLYVLHQPAAQEAKTALVQVAAEKGCGPAAVSCYMRAFESAGFRLVQRKRPMTRTGLAVLRFIR